jgi:Kef-type K+ transport system membrane component KefB
MHAPVNTISPETFLAIMAAAAIAGTVASFASRAGIVLPVVVVELLAAIVLGPHVLGLQVSSAVLFFKDLGLGLLFFFAGYELDCATATKASRISALWTELCVERTIVNSRIGPNSPTAPAPSR